MAELRLVPDLPELVPGVWPSAPVLDVVALEDAELRLLALATGEQLPAELHARVLRLRVERARLLRELGEGGRV